MKPNMGTIDRIIRAIVGIALIATWSFDLLQGVSATIALVVGIVMLLTALLRWCPPYAQFGINTGARDG